MTLKDTVDDMLSADYKKRFIAEYNQLIIRLTKLYDFLSEKDDKTLNNGNIKLLKYQADYMEAYAGILRDRAAIEGIELD